MTNERRLARTTVIVAVLILAIMAVLVNAARETKKAVLPSNLTLGFSVIERPTHSVLYKGIFSASNLASNSAAEKPTVEAVLQNVQNNNNQDKQFYHYYNGLLVDSVTNQCSSNNIVPIEIFSLITSAQQLFDSSSNQVSSTSFDAEVNKCLLAKNQLRLFHVNGEAMVLCAKVNKHGLVQPKRIISQGFIVKFDSKQTTETLALGATSSVVNSKCGNVSNKMAAAKLRLYKMKKQQAATVAPWYTQAKLSCQLAFLRDEKVCNALDFATAEPTKICIFLHGAGQTDHETGPPVQEFKSYWGNVNQYTPQCKERWFIREETKLQTWETPHLQEAYCKLALYNQTEGDKVIRNKILFVHSMGNLILANAIRNGICDIDVNTTSYYSLGAPWIGSKASPVVEDICATIRTGRLPPWTQVYKMYKYVAEKLGYCMPHTNETYPVYKSFDPNNKDIHTLFSQVKDKMKGSMCGSSAFGLTSTYSAALEIFSGFVQYHENNDGFVPVSSCKQHQEEGLFEKVPAASFYLAETNHADETCRNGDGIGNDRKPCSYFVGKQ